MRLILCLLGTHESEGIHRGYRALQWGELARCLRMARRAALVYGKDRHLRRLAGRLRAEPNNQTGSPQTVDWMKSTATATNTIWHDRSHVSRIIVPLMKTAR